MILNLLFCLKSRRTSESRLGRFTLGSGPLHRVVRRGGFLRLTTAELIRVKRHKLPDTHRRLAGYPRYAVCHAVKPTRPVQLSDRYQMFDQVLRHARLFQPLCPIVGRNVSVGDFTVQRFRILPSDPIHVLRTRTGEFVDPAQVWLRMSEDRSDNARDISRRNWTGLAFPERQFDAASLANTRTREGKEKAFQENRWPDGDDRQAGPRERLLAEPVLPLLRAWGGVLDASG